mmetsp:Transcript_27902/g.34071  ORF Transcript_27902/g.34071 Transcript_27902/m.34071 type:complete len:179 (-) Transcript_27902:147-683(-)
MGGSASKKRNIIRILLLGLDGAGKTTLLYKITGGKSDVLGAPTVGFNAETINWDKKTILNIWDVGGQDKFRDLWRQYFAGTDGVLFVVDTNDVSRLDKAMNELHGLCNEIELKYATYAIIANKQDLPNSISNEELKERIKLNLFKPKHKVFQTIATHDTRTGIKDALIWLVNEIKKSM